MNRQTHSLKSPLYPHTLYCWRGLTNIDGLDFFLLQITVLTHKCPGIKVRAWVSSGYTVWASTRQHTVINMIVCGLGGKILGKSIYANTCVWVQQLICGIQDSFHPVHARVDNCSPVCLKSQECYISKDLPRESYRVYNVHNTCIGYIAGKYGIKYGLICDCWRDILRNFWITAESTILNADRMPPI